MQSSPFCTALAHMVSALAAVVPPEGKTDLAEGPHFAYTAGMSQRPQPSCSAMSVASVTGHDARSALLPRFPASRSSEPLLLLLSRLALDCSASCSALCPGDRPRAVGLVAWAITATRLGLCVGAMALPRLRGLRVSLPSLHPGR